MTATSTATRIMLVQVIILAIMRMTTTSIIQLLPETLMLIMRQ